ncbi:uncharacterized protein ces2b isoform X12 [Astyanax mexicanus]|uniref:uncharacterized protein ces2b isoform X11 n=1 Tax=Astyanax mexicanus TaxID=7994 RepID=UPI0020CB36DC|nr:uncharacterized protein ces2b isoform X11 [Astyanax mexicanus]XP_049330630.1 uncharacterized protein ces2b isoform X12 [Astyanax mexicanus]
MGGLALLVCSVMGAALLNPAAANQGPVVQTKLGALKGEYLTVKGKDTVVHSYLGVPFAKPPLGPLRLAPPQPAEAWAGVRDATQQPYMCLQKRKFLLDIIKTMSVNTEIPEVSEDCLYLNIYTPSKPDEDAKLPVLVWIHGGGFVLGAAAMQDGSGLAAYQNVVVVIIQYRLGLTGFFSTGDEHAPGNYGLLDQLAALRWVQENIQSFGGDPAKVTIFGESAGGVSVSLQILSPMSAGLFRYAIAQSGTAAMDVLMTSHPLPAAQRVANASGCDISSIKKMVECVMQLSEEELVKIAQNAELGVQITTDGQFLPKPAEKLLQNKEFKKVPLITGVTDDEGGYSLPNFLAPPDWVDGMEREKVLSLMAAIFPTFGDKSIHEALLNEYVGTTNDLIKIRDGFREMYGDIMFNIPARITAQHHKDSGAPVYLYEFQHTFTELKKKRPSFTGSDHADELHFVFGNCFVNGRMKILGQFTEKENELCRTMMAYWGNFARTGSPNGPGLTPWPEHGADAEYLAIGLQQKPAKNLKEKHYTFITETLPRLIREKKDGPVVQTKLGALKGEYLTAKGKDTVVHSYMGVPFAKPLRLAPPQPAEAWAGVREATQHPNICIQNRPLLINLFQGFSNIKIPEASEDCLYLNVYTPAKPGEDAKLPVMVWIHGGALTIGGTFMQDGGVLSAYQNVVVVVIQYRLGILGFFSTGDEHSPGNYGLLDQVAALQWVQENIYSFGGDPGKVTIFGESAGGVSVSLQILSPLSAGLFHSAVAQSGSSAVDAIWASDPLPTTQHLANISGCDISSSKTMVDCVMKLSKEELLRNAEAEGLVSVQVAKDGRFLPKSIKELLQNKQFHKVPLMTGLTDDEGGFGLIDFLLPQGEWMDGVDREQVMAFMPFFCTSNDRSVHEALLNEYVGPRDDRIKIRDALREIYGDVIFNIPVRRMAKHQKDSGAPVYIYEFQHTLTDIKNKRPSFVGTDHGDELHFVFGSCFANAHIKIPSQFTEKENELCRTVMAYWGNFARTGSPNGPGLTPWPEHGADAEYLAIGLEQKPAKNLKGKHYTFLTETLPRLIREKKDGPVVQTKLGALKGEYFTAKGKDTVIHSYLGVPFAKPPLGPLRLVPPQPAEAWEGVRDATQQPYMCIQNRQATVDLFANFSLSMEIPDISEDCLYLNIYTPAKPAQDIKLPVMVWIHGGGLSLGSASVYDGSVLAAYQDVVVVLIQYRLGLLGFFSTGDENAPGNYGLLDQVAALQWVQENIHSFGGDPGSVTIFGESAGGASVSFLLLSPLSAGLFHRAIAESGCAMMPGIMVDPFPVAQHVANVSGCDISSTKKIAECVKQFPIENIKRLSEERAMLHFVVTEDKAFLPKPVKELLQNQEFHKVPLMTGVNDDEFGWEMPSIIISPEWAKEMDREQVLSIMSFFDSNTKTQLINELLADEYLGSSVDPINIRDSFREMMADIIFNIPALSLAKFHKAAGAPVYFYEFQHPPSMFQVKRPSFVGADHGDELAFVFGLCFGNAHVIATGSFTEKENELCRTVMDYWGNFARTGSPNGPGLTPWPEHGADAEYLAIGLEQKPGKNLKEKSYTFITETLPRLIREKKDGPVVQTKLGVLKGEYLTVKGKETVVHSYLGVPFAKPPLGPLRLAPPQPAEAWEGVRDATQQPYMCIQNRQATVEIFGNFSLGMEIPDISEDCLYLNIYTPAKPAQDIKLPVMVWIHGGGLNMGFASTSDGSILAAYQNVVVVVIQYRLSLLGFFSTGDEHAPGNYGLLDQVAALQWVQENIHSFGGDPGSVTIFGESAGGASVSFLLLSPLSAGLFHRAIAESGCATMGGMIADPFPVAQHVANVSGCDISSTKKIAECVKQLPIEDIKRLTEESAMLQFVVTEDKAFLPKPVKELLQNQEFHKVPLMIGVNDDEFGWVMPSIFLTPEWAKGMDREQVLSVMNVFDSNKRPRWINELLADEYLGSSVDPIKIRDSYREMMADIIFNIPALSLAKFHKAAGAPVYFYEFQHPPSMFQVKRPSFVGTDHGDEVYYVFGLCFCFDTFTEKENELCGTVMEYWGNFARTGSPNGPGLTPWPEHGADAEYLAIGLQQKPGKNLKEKHYTFMTETLPRLIREKKDGPVIQTKLGALKGEYLTVKGKDTVIHSYLGVPFAKPPLGPLRLAPPQPAEAWEGVRDATQQPNMCIQKWKANANLFANFLRSVEVPDISEDCLYLNIYTPAKPAQDIKLPVMVWIHGGGFNAGSASIFDGSILAAYQDVVVVVIQYRLGLLGFFSTGDEHAPGNYGLLDQVAALQWVQENIHSFGGDPGSVTIFGESAGGISVSLLLLSPLSAGLFHRGIAESGCAVIAGIVEDPVPSAQHVAKVSGCDMSSTKKIAECVKQLPIEDIRRLTEGGVKLKFVVTEDKAFLPKPVNELLQNQDFHKLPLMIGVNNDEFGWLIPNAIMSPEWAKGVDREQVLSIMSAYVPNKNPQWIKLLADEYLGSSVDPIKIRDCFRELMADILFYIPVLSLAKFHKAAGAPVYFYEFQQPLSMFQVKRPSYVGADHGDEIAFVFGLCFGNGHVTRTGSVTEKDNELCRTVMNYWGNFARTGSPNGPGLTPWPEYGSDVEYLGIGLEQKPGKNLKAEHYIFMTEKLPELVRSAQEKEHSEL